MSKASRLVNGYVLLYRPDHFNCMTGSNWSGYVYEHRFLMEKELGRALNQEEIVHHLDCNKTNNSLANLIVVSRSDHGKIHAWIDNGATGGESLRRKGMNSKKANPDERKRCVICESHLQGTNKVTCSIECHSKRVATTMRKVERPSYEDLLRDTSTLPMTKVGSKYGVSDNAVRKWMKLYKKSSMPTLSQAMDTSVEGAETSGEVQPS